MLMSMQTFVSIIMINIDHAHNFLILSCTVSVDIGVATITHSTSANYLGQSGLLVCSVDVTPNPLPANVPAPKFEWFYGPDKALPPSDVFVSPVTNNGNTYTSSLQFPTLLLSHIGMYTCRLGGNDKLSANTELLVRCGTQGNFLMIAILRIICIPSNTVTVNGDQANVFVGDKYMLTCSHSHFTGDVTYQWIKDNSTIKNETGSTLSFSSLKLSDAGRYYCQVTINSTKYCGVMDISLESTVHACMQVSLLVWQTIKFSNADTEIICINCAAITVANNLY